MPEKRGIEIALCVFREANDALIVFDPRDRRTVDLNPTALRLTGFDRKAMLAMKLADLISSPDPNDLKRLIAACQQTSFFHSQEGFYLTRKDGEPIPVNVSVSRIHTSPDPLGLAIIRDVSERKQAENEIRLARENLETRVRDRTAELDGANQAMRLEIAERLRVEAELRQAKEAAEAAGRVKDQFLAVLSHELRTPLTPVLAVVSALLDEPSTSAEFRPVLEMIRRNIALEARLIDDLLDLIRAQRDKLRLNLERADAHSLIDQVIEICQHEANQAKVRLETRLEASDHHVQVEPTRLQQVAWNLVQNAVKCTREGGHVVVRTRNEEEQLLVSVEDDGIGIEPEFLSVIFDPFEQGQTPLRRRIGGLGLGLSISRSIIEAHGGRLIVQSEGTDRGATFTFDLPVVPPPASVPVSPASTTPRAVRTGLKILLVEDNKDVLRYLTIVFEMRGHHVTPAADLTSAIQRLGGDFDILVSDIELPDGSGLDLMRELRGKIPGIAISGFGGAEDIRMSLGAGFALHLTKPIEAQQLELAIREVAGRGLVGSG